MGQYLSWLEHTTDNREVDGSSPFWPTKLLEVRSKRLTEVSEETEASLSLLEIEWSFNLIEASLSLIRLKDVPWKLNREWEKLWEGNSKETNFLG